jgi:hypothetical protein
MTIKQAQKKIDRLMQPRKTLMKSMENRHRAYMISLEFGLPDPIKGPGMTYRKIVMKGENTAKGTR